MPSLRRPYADFDVAHVVARRGRTWPQYDLSATRTTYSISRRVIQAELFCTRTLAARANRALIGRRAREREAALTIRFRESDVLEAMFPGRSALWLEESARRLRGERSNLDVAKLSFFDDPEHVLEIFHRLIEAECLAERCSLNLDLPMVDDLGPLLVLSEIWSDLTRVFDFDSVTPAARKVIDGTKIGDVLGLPATGRDNGDDIWAFPRDRRHETDTSTSLTRHLDVPRRDDIAGRLADQVSGWIRTITKNECELSERGGIDLIRLITEILDNAERHSAPSTRDGSWTISSFMVRSGEPDAVRFECHLAFLSFGASFADSLALADHESRSWIDEYVRRHDTSAPQSRATLATVMALQDWITCDPDADEDRRGGFGLMHALGFVNALGGGCSNGDEPQLVIVSGNSCIRCRVPYLEPAEESENMRRTLWFNAENAPEIAPDRHFVHDLQRRFPGTVISVKFCMNEAHLRKLANDGDDDS